MTIVRGISIGAASAIVSLALLFLAYPWSTYYGNFTYGFGLTLGSYLCLAFLVGLLAAIAVSVTERNAKATLATRCVLAGLSTLAVLCAVSLLFGPAGLDLFGTRVRGIFFSEWKFVTFMCVVALPVSILDAALLWWSTQRKD